MSISKHKIADLLERASKSTIERIGVFANYLKEPNEAYKYNEDTYSSIFGQELLKLLDNSKYSRTIVINQMPVYNEDKSSAGITDIAVYFNYGGEDYEIIIEAKFWRYPEEETWDISIEKNVSNQLINFFNTTAFGENPFQQMRKYITCDDPFIKKLDDTHRFGVVLIYHKITDTIDSERYFKAIRCDEKAIFSSVEKEKNFCVYGEVYDMDVIRKTKSPYKDD